MVYIVGRWEHADTTAEPRARTKQLHFMSYDRLMSMRRFPMATYIFTDIDRMSYYELEVCAVLYRELRDSGAIVLNDPARVLTRFDLLSNLYREKINDFNVYRPQYGDWPVRYPVFLRRNAFHQGVCTDLLNSQEEVKFSMLDLIEQGIPQVNIMAVEYAAEACETGIYRKYAVYRIGDRYFQDTSVNQQHWEAKHGQAGIAGEGFYKKESEGMDTVPFPDTIKKVFELGNIEYGRVDFGIVGGKPQFYEINTNPTVSLSTEHDSAYRRQSRNIFVRNYLSAIELLQAQECGGYISTRNKLLRKVRKKNLLKKRIFHFYRSRASY